MRVNYVWAGLAALGMGAWWLSRRQPSSEIREQAKVLQEQNEQLTQLEAMAAAAAAKAQEAVNQAQNAADAAGTNTSATSYLDAEGDNSAAQGAASTSPGDAAAAAAAAQAAARAAAARAELERSMAAQLTEAESAAAKARTCLQTAYGSYQQAMAAYADYQAYINARMTDKLQICGYLHKDGNQKGAVKAFRLGDTKLSDFNDVASSYTLFPGYKFLLFEHGDFSGGTFGWVYGNNPTNTGELTGFNDRASAIRCQAYPNANIFVSNLAARRAEADRIKLEVTNCQAALNVCIERVQSIIDQIRAYNVLSSRINTTEASLVALRGYVASISV